MSEKHADYKFTRADWFKLFLLASFPLHIWTLLMAFRDVNWVAERTTMWDGIGFVSYALLYTLVESALLFGFIALLSLLTPRNWNRTLRLTVLGSLGFLLAGWSILEQLILIVFYGRLRKLGMALPNFFGQLWIPMTMLVVLITISALVPIWLLHTKPGFRKGLNTVFDRLILLSGLYLFLDFAGIILIIIRNTGG
jgi:hypothetical protein